MEQKLQAYGSKLRVIQSHGITLRDKITNLWFRQRTKVVDVMERMAFPEWKWARHIPRITAEQLNQDNSSHELATIDDGFG